MEELYKEIFSIKKEFSLILNVIIYSKNEHILVKKEPFYIPYVPIFLANSNKEIIDYINSQDYLNCGIYTIEDDFNKIINSMPEKGEIFLEKEEKEIIDDESNVKDGWELIEKIPKNIFEKILCQCDWHDSVSEMKRNMLKMLKENVIGGNENEKYKYLKYFGFTLFPEIKSYLIDIIVKQFCYAYTKNEKKFSFYYILNKELRTGDSSKINKYMELISIINEAIEQKAIKSYKGQLYRATIIEDKIINNILIIDKKISNLQFFSTTKIRKKAEDFLSQPNKNVLFIIETNEKNIDIDSENISEFKNEKEVLFIPYSKFLVEDKKKILFKDKNGNTKEIYEIKLKALDDKHERNNIKFFNLSGKQLLKLNEIEEKFIGNGEK